MGFSARILADSITASGDRLTTFELQFPRIVLSEFNTHCAISRNSASSRAVPVRRKILDALNDPFVPDQFGVNQAGMQASKVLEGDDHEAATEVWLQARDAAVVASMNLILGAKAIGALPGDHDERVAMVMARLSGGSDPVSGGLNVHKQLVNRLLEPFQWHTVIATATDWSNFFALRLGEGAQREIKAIAALMLAALNSASPVKKDSGSWHLPLVLEDEREDAVGDPDRWVLISAARCARVSYETHGGSRDPSADTALAERLLLDGHMSPFEHVARAMTLDELTRAPKAGKLRGWVPYRSTIPMEDDYSKVLAARAGGVTPTP